MARIRIAGTSGASENTIVFSPAGGHSHNGRNSSLIDSNAYSMYDFSPTFVGTEVNPDRAVRQENNRIALEDTIKRVVNNSVLAPAGIRLEQGSLNGSLIIANTITANQIAANTITADELVSNIVLINNIIRSNNYTAGTGGTGGVGWKISNDGSAEFSNVVVRGNIFSNVGTIGGWTISNTSINSGNTYLYSNGQITNGNFSVSNTGVLTATGASFSGTITGTTTATADLFVREPTGGRFYLTYLLGDYVQIKRTTDSSYSSETGSGAFLGYFNASTVADDSTMVVNSTTPVASGTFVQASSSGNLTATGTITAAAFNGNASSATNATNLVGMAKGFAVVNMVAGSAAVPHGMATIPSTALVTNGDATVLSASFEIDSIDATNINVRQIGGTATIGVRIDWIAFT